MANPRLRANAGESRLSSLPPIRIGSSIGFDQSRGDSEESRFAGAVFAHQSVNLSRSAFEVDSGQRSHRPELAGDTRQFEDGGGLSSTLPENQSLASEHPHQNIIGHERGP